MKKANPVSVEGIRQNMRQAAQESGMTQDEIGLSMGFSKGGSRQAVSRLLHSDSKYDPRLSTLLAFAKAIKKSLKDLL